MTPTQHWKMWVSSLPRSNLNCSSKKRSSRTESLLTQA